MRRLLVSLLLGLQTPVFLEFGQMRTLLLGLLFLSERALLGSRHAIVGVLAPVWEVTVTLHVVLGESEDLQGLNEELFLC